MKHKTRVLGLLFAGLFLFAGCAGSATLLAKPENVTPLSYTEYREKGEEFHALAAAAEKFAARFAPKAAMRAEGNVALAPVSAFSALALAARCASGETANELYTALGVSEGTLDAHFADFIRSLLDEDKEGLSVASELAIGNSVWIDAAADVNESCVRTLAEKYLCYSYAADFANDNGGANRSVRNFVKDATRGRIDREFHLPAETLFTLITTLYLKDTWNVYGEELPLTEQEYPFNGESVRLIQGYYEAGRAYKGENFTSFFAVTEHNYRLHFLVPDEGVAVEDVFTEQTLSALRGFDYRADDEAAMTHYFTRCLFPGFEGAFDGDIRPTLGELGVERLFRDPTLPDGCTFATLTPSPVCCGEVRHVTSLKVTRRGIEGAAVVVLPMAGAPGPDGWETVYEDFAVTRSFGFVLTDSRGATLFSGIIRTV